MKLEIQKDIKILLKILNESTMKFTNEYLKSLKELIDKFDKKSINELVKQLSKLKKKQWKIIYNRCWRKRRKCISRGQRF